MWQTCVFLILGYSNRANFFRSSSPSTGDSATCTPPSLPQWPLSEQCNPLDNEDPMTIAPMTLHSCTNPLAHGIALIHKFSGP